ncbi:tetratricopeptide repeat protein [bacterium]|nr:tetratricopeptide repeat protein [candidate division CSSED10-310 bacterium]
MEQIKLGNRTYNVSERLGRGGTCEVYKIICDTTQEIHALKVLLGAQNARRFRREFRSMAKLDHPNIARVFEYGEYQERPCYSMEYIAGGDMKAWLKNEMGIVSTGVGGAPSSEGDFKRIVSLFIEICRPLSYIHSNRILHRDLKPANIMLTEKGEVRLMDFGLIKEMDIIQETLTRTGTFVGTVAYMSPEQGMGRHLDHRSDLYSLGVILYESLSGRLPFLGTSVVQVLMKHINSPPETPSSINSAIPASLESLAMKMLQKEPSARVASADEVIDYLGKYLQSDIQTMLETMESLVCDDTSSSSAIGTPGLLVPGLIGREAEMAMIRTALDNLEGNKPGIISVCGELGSGKSAFVKEVGTAARMHRFSLLRGSCTEVERFPYGAFLRPLESIADRLASKDEAYSRSVIGEMGPILTAVCPAFRQIPWVGGQQTPEPLEALQEKLRTFDAIRTILENFSGEGGLVMILEDLQWADDLSLELVHFLGRNLSRTDRTPPALLLMLTWRPEDMPKTGIAGRFRKSISAFQVHQDIVLKPLDRKLVEKMLHAMLGDRNVDTEVVQEVYKDSGGNPFFIHEIVKNLVEKNVLRKIDGTWRLDLSDTMDTIPIVTTESLLSAVISVPDRVRDIISQRLEKLDENTQKSLRIAAVIGIEFEFDLLLAVSEEDEDDLLDQIDNAMKEDLVDEVPGCGGEVFRFRQNMIRQVLYNAMPDRRAARIHRKIAEVIENKFGWEDQEQWELLAFHYDRGGQKKEAVRFYRLAGQRAITFAAETSLNYANRIIELAQEFSSRDHGVMVSKSEALKLIGKANELTGDLDKAEAAYNQLLELGRETGNAMFEALGLQYLGGINSDRGDYDKAIEIYAKSLKIAAGLENESLLLANVMANIASVYMNQGRYQDSLKTFDVVCRKMEKIGQKSGVATCELNQGLCHYYLGDYADALALLNSSVDGYKRINHQYQAVKALNNIGGIHHALGDTLKAMECFSQSLEISRKTGDLYSVGAIQGNLGVLYHERGLFTRAAASLEEALSIGRKLGDRPGIATSLINLATLRMDQGELRQTHGMLDEAFRIAEKMGDRFLIVYAQVLQGDLYMLYGDLASSLELNEKGRKTAMEIGLKSQELISTANIAWIKAQQGNTAQSIDEAQQTVTSSETLGDSDSILRSRYRLAEIYLLNGNFKEARLTAAPGLRLAGQRSHITYKWLFASCIGRSWFDQEQYQRAYLSFRLVIQLLQALKKQLEPALNVTFFCQPSVRKLLEDIRETTEIIQRSDAWALTKKLLELGDQ